MKTNNAKMEHSASVPVNEKAVEGLIKFLAADYALYVKTQNYHWNVTGPTFHSLHEMFEEQYQALLLEIDDTAERIRSLGYFVPASLGDFKRLSVIQDETQIPDAQDMIRILVDGHTTIIEHGKKLLHMFEEAQDDATMDFIVETIERHEKTLWMLTSSLMAGAARRVV